MSEWGGGVAAYIRVATDLRARIESGALPPGAQLPSVTALMGEFKVANTTVQKAIRALKAAGLVDSKPGKGVFVREVQRIVSRSADFTAPVPEGQKAPHGLSTPVVIAEVVPPEDVAERLGLEPDDTAIKRSRNMLEREDGPVFEITTSYFPSSIAKGTELERSAKLKGATPGALVRLGYAPRRCQERVEARMPTAAEAQMLNLTPGTPVLRLLRVVWTDNDLPVEALEIVFGADRYLLEYDLPVTRD